MTCDIWQKKYELNCAWWGQFLLGAHKFWITFIPTWHRHFKHGEEFSCGDKSWLAEWHSTHTAAEALLLHPCPWTHLSGFGFFLFTIYWPFILFTFAQVSFMDGLNCPKTTWYSNSFNNIKLKDLITRLVEIMPPSQYRSTHFTNEFYPFEWGKHVYDS